jgi:HAD superfamily hydrolase (TIGR01509 family)
MNTALPWDEIRTVLLDLDGTLLDLNFDNHFWHNHVPYCYACKHDLDIEQAQQQVFPKYKRAEGTLNWYCVDYWTRTLDLDIVKLKQQQAHRVRPRADALVFLDWLKQKGLDLRLVTNAHRKTLEIKLAQTQISGYFDLLACSHEYGAAKEHPEFWPVFNARHPFEPDATLFVDDNLDVLRTARDFGIRHLCAIQQPDSGKPVKQTEEFMAIHEFADIMETATDK